MMIKQLLNILCCPKCNNKIELSKNFLLCKTCSIAYPFFNNIPNMLIDDALDINKIDKKLMHSINTNKQ
ncbi:MAG: hypothetical protein B6U87_02675 [Candidatus Aenigmarchaeota archaeon ex4484_52]|nr:MAG: hypothetical protein B6U87_02675 [Candidatus Aenigmarchaeota archaeon ex4484_52]